MALISKLYENKTKGEIDDEMFVLLISSFKKEREQICQRNSAIHNQLQRYKHRLDGLDYFQILVTEQTEIAVLTREVLGQLVDWIAIFPANRDGKERDQKYKIHYQFIGALEVKEV